MKTTISIVFLLVFPWVSNGQTYRKLKSETVEQFALRVKPEKSRLVHSVIETDIWQLAQKCIVAIYQVGSESDDPVAVKGVLYYPIDSASYKCIGFGPIDTVFNAPAEVLAVFFVNADKDSQKELAVLCGFDFHNRDAAGRFYSTYLFDNPSTTAAELLYLEELSDKFDDCDCIATHKPATDQKGKKDTATFNTAKAIRTELKRLGF